MNCNHKKKKIEKKNAYDLYEFRICVLGDEEVGRFAISKQFALSK